MAGAVGFEPTNAGSKNRGINKSLSKFVEIPRLIFF